MAVYTRQIETSRRMLSAYGRAVTLYTFADATPDATKPWRTGAPTASTQAGFAAFFDYTVKEIDGELIHVGDKKAYLAASGLTVAPTPKGEIRYNSEIWKIINVETLAPNASEPILYILQLRQ